MCGIFAAISMTDHFTENQISLFHNSLEIIKYRGPDARSYKSFNSLSSEKQKSNIYLGHNRLAIIDLSEDGIQPFTNDNKIFLTFNGEIYNYIELRAELILKGHLFKTQTDIEVIVNLYKQYGTSGFNKMNGMWAFVLYDSDNKKIIASRDRFSIKPLYLLREGNCYYMSSEIKQILPFLSEKRINKNVLGNYLHKYIFDYSDNTFFQKIEKVKSKHNLVIDLATNTTTLEPYWDFVFDDFSGRSHISLQEEYQHLFHNAVEIRMRSDVKLGNTLSGGLDSSSIALVANKYSKEPLLNISVITKNKKFSEEKYVDELIKKNILVQKIQIDNTSPWANLKKIIWHNDEPILSMSTVAHFNMMKKFSEETDITVILSGQGGDESLAGYNKYFFYKLAELKRKGAYLSLFNDAIRLLPKFFSEFELNYAQRYLKGNGRKTIIDEVVKFDYRNDFINTAKTFVDRQILDINKFSVPALTHYEDRSSMHQSKEIRLPFLDYRLVNFSLNLPLEMKIHNGYNKYILRKSMKDLPNSIAWRRDKKGFTIDERSFYTKEGYFYIKSMFKNSKLESLGLIDANKFISEFDNFIKGKRKYWVRNINRIIFAEVWAKTYFE